MILILASLVLTFAWAAVTGSFSTHNLVLGFLVSALSLAVVRKHFPESLARVRADKLFLLVLLFFKELWLSAFKVAVVVLRRDMALKPGIFAYPLQVRRDFEITLLANLITLTPGTLSVDVSEDRRLLYVHALNCADPDAERAAIASGFERLIREAFPA